MDLFLIVSLFFILILFLGLLLFVQTTIKQINKRYQSIDEVNAIRKESLEVQKETLMK